MFLLVEKPFMVYFWIPEWVFSSCVNTGSIQTDCNLFSPAHWPCHCIINCHKCQCSSPLGTYCARVCVRAHVSAFLSICLCVTITVCAPIRVHKGGVSLVCLRYAATQQHTQLTKDTDDTGLPKYSWNMQHPQTTHSDMISPT